MTKGNEVLEGEIVDPNIDYTDIENIESILPDKIGKEEFIKGVVSLISKKAKSLCPDMSTADGRDSVRSNAYNVAQSKVALVKRLKELTEEWRLKTKEINCLIKYVEKELDEVKNTVREPYTEWEEAEKLRKRKVESGILELKEFKSFPSLDTEASEIKSRIELVEEYIVDPAIFKSSLELAETEKQNTISFLKEKLEAQLKHDADQAELAQLRKDAEERDRIEAERKAKEEADRIAKEEEEAKAKAEDDAKVKAEQDEKDRISGIQDLFNRYYQRHSTMSHEGITVEELNFYIKGLTGQLEDLSCFGERAEEAQGYIESIIEDSTVKRDFKLKILKDQEEKERLAREEQIRKDAEAKAKREAEEKALADAKKADDEAKAREAKIEADRLQAIKDKEAAEQREKDAIQAERERVAAEKAKQAAIDKKREENKKHRAKIEGEVYEDIDKVLFSQDEPLGMDGISSVILTAIINNKIRHTTIKY